MMMTVVRISSLIAAGVGAAGIAAAQSAPAPAASDAASAQQMASDNAPPAANPADPFEGFNRSIFSFNEGLDKAILKPVAETYRKVLPQPVRTGVSNVFGNVGDAWSAVNQMLQGKVQNSLEMGMRVAMNSVFGLGGLLDPASEAGLERRPEDFGQTLGVWGFKSGPYLVLPVFGPSSIRDGLALPVDQVASPGNYISPTAAATGVTLLRVVDTRAGLLNLTNLAGDLALDKYSFYRDAYIARRFSQVYDGNPPEPADEGASSETNSEPR